MILCSVNHFCVDVFDYCPAGRSNDEPVLVSWQGQPDSWRIVCLIILLSVRGGKINMGPFPGKFVTVPVVLKYCPIGRYGQFQASSFFVAIPSLLKLNTFFPHLI